MKQLVLSLLLLTIISLSCKQDPAPRPTPAPSKKVIKISSAQDDYQMFEYNGQGHVAKYVAQWKNGTGTLNKITHTMEYNGSKLEKTTNDVGYTLFTYQEKQLLKAENFFSNNKKLSTLFFNYTPQYKLDYVIEQIAFPVEGGATETKVSYQYYPSGNVSRVDFAYRKHSADPFVVSFSKVFVQYDSQSNPEPDGILGNYIPGILLHINNPVKVNNLDKDGKVEGYSRYEYIYNAAGNPLQRKHFIAVGTVEQAPVTYQYQY